MLDGNWSRINVLACALWVLGGLTVIGGLTWPERGIGEVGILLAMGGAMLHTRALRNGLAERDRLADELRRDNVRSVR